MNCPKCKAFVMTGQTVCWQCDNNLVLGAARESEESSRPATGSLSHVQITQGAEPGMERGAERAEFFGTAKKYRTIMLDPPWPIKWNAASSIGKRNLQYQTMPISEIVALPIDELADEHCLLVMWVTNSFLPEGLGITRLWKFHYDKLFTWCKNNGMGGHPRNATEHAIISSRGEPQMRGRHDAMILNWLECPRTAKHSEKPVELRRVIEQFAPSPRIELFARERHEGWEAWGNEILPVSLGGGGGVLVGSETPPTEAKENDRLHDQ